MERFFKITNLIKEFEGFRAKVYICPAGFKTIGYGHTLSINDALNNISEEEAENLLQQDIANAQNSVFRNIKATLTQGQFDALTSFTFNLGAAALQRSTLRQKINRSEHHEVPKEFMRWIYASGVILPGLIRRRQAEVFLYNS